MGCYNIKLVYIKYRYICSFFSSSSWARLSFLFFSNEEGNVAVVLEHVPLEDVWARTQDPFEPHLRDLDALQKTAGRHGGSSRPVEEQSNLSEIFWRSETSDFDRFSPLVPDLSDGDGPVDDDEEVVSGLALRHDDGAVLEWNGLQRVSDGQAFPLVEVLEDWNFAEKLFVHFALPDGGAHQDPAVRVAVDSPQLDVGRGFDGGGSRSSVDEGEFSEGSSFSDVEDFLSVDVDLDLSVVDDVEVVTLVTLLNDNLTL